MATVLSDNTTATAPGLTGMAGSLIAVLDFALVTRAGWEKAFSGTNKAVYRCPTGNRRYIRIDDTIGQYAALNSYETMTTIDAGTGPCPATAAVYIGKSIAVSAVERPWCAVVNKGTVIFYAGVDGITPNTPGVTYNGIFVFGDFTSYLPGDSFNTVVAAGSTASYGSASDTKMLGYSLTASTSGVHVQRAYTQTGSAISAGRISNFAESDGGTQLGGGGSPLPNPIDGNMHMARVYLTEGVSSKGVRGHIPGMWNPLHPVPFTQGDTFTGSGDLVGRTFRVFVAAQLASGRVFIETSDTWD